MMYKARKKDEADYNANHLRVAKGDIVKIMVEILLCRVIIERVAVRYLGNCYGSQVMWVALGGGLTTYKRKQSLQHNATMIPDSEDSLINVNWDDGMSEMSKVGPNPVHPTAELSDHAMNEFFDYGMGAVEYNTDYHHSFMLILSKRLQKLEDGKIPKDPKFTALSHKLSDKITNYDDTHGNVFEKKVVKYAENKPKPEEGTESGKVWRTWRWVGTYAYDQRIYGFQGHPLYHLTEYSGSWNADEPSIANNELTARNPNYQNTANLIWNHVFQF